MFRANTRILTFGILLVFFSSFGQTFVVSLYIPSIIDHFGISSSLFSTIYALATLLSASTLVFAGRKIDYIPLKRFSLFVVAGIISATLLLALSWHLAVLFVGIYLVRLFGQGLLSHTALTTMSRYFKKARGKAIGIAYLGFPLGEAVFPVLVAASIAYVGWRETLGMSALFIAIVLLPLSVFLIRGFSRSGISEDDGNSHSDADKYEGQEARTWSQKQVLGTRWFYIIAPTVFLVGFLQTALFFFQTFIARENQWTSEWMAGSIVAYALSSFTFSIACGPLIDRFGAKRLFPFILIPLAMGLGVLAMGDQLWIAPVYWLLVGFSGGMNAPVTSALYAEIYGTRSLGTVRSLFTFVMVLSTAIGPVVYSFFLERGYGFDQIHFGVIAVILVNMLYKLLSRGYPSDSA